MSTPSSDLDHQAAAAAPTPSASEPSIAIELRTDLAHRFLAGRKAAAGKPAIMGLFGFADRLNDIWRAAHAGDPYARWWLLKIEAACAEAKLHVHAERVAVEKTLSRWQELCVMPPKQQTLRRIELRFACPYAYWAARELREFDRFASDLHLAVRIGARAKSRAIKTRQRCARALRHLFASVQGYRDFGLTSEIVARGDPRVADADTLLGPIPRPVLEGKQWPKLLEREHAMETEDEHDEPLAPGP